MRASSRLSLLDGISTSWCAAVMPLRTRVRKSDTGSVIDIGSPGALGHARHVAVVRELAQADAAHAELAVHRAGAAAAPAAGVLAGLVLGGARLAHALRGLRHQALSPFWDCSVSDCTKGLPSRLKGMPNASRRA